MSALLFLLLASTGALAEDIDITLCVKIHTDFEDPGGDLWATNGNRRARGAYYVVADNHPLGMSGFLDEDGCKDLTIDVTDTYDVTIFSEAQVNGIDLESYEVSCTGWNGDDCETWDEALASYTVADIAKVNTTPLLIVPGDQTWYNLAVGMFAVHRNDMNLGTYSSIGAIPLDGRLATFPTLSLDAGITK